MLSGYSQFSMLQDEKNVRVWYTLTHGGLTMESSKYELITGNLYYHFSLHLATEIMYIHVHNPTPSRLQVKHYTCHCT